MKQRSTLFLLLADHLAGLAANIYLVAALMLVSQKVGSGVVLAEMMLLTQAATLLALPVTGMVSEKLGAVRALSLSLLLFAVMPIGFFVSGVSIGSLRAFSVGSGIAMAINLPSSAAFTYMVVPTNLLPRMFVFILATSAIDGVGLLLSPCLFSIRPVLPFAVASMAFLLCAWICRAGGMCAVATRGGDSCQPAAHGVIAVLRFCMSRRFLCYAAAQTVYGIGFYVLLFLIPMRLILPLMRGSPDGAGRVATLLTIVVVGAMLTTVMINYVMKITITTIRVTFVMMAIASVVASLSCTNTYALCATFSLFAPLLFTGGNAIFSSLGKAFDVRSPGMQGVFQALSLFGGVVAFAAVNVALKHVDIRWIVLAYGGLSLVASVLVPTLEHLEQGYVGSGEVSKP